MITLTKEDAIDGVRDAMSDVCDMDVGFTDYAKAALRYLEKHGLTYARDEDAPCPACGKPADTKSCAMGGCPLGADL